jgi:hypothetical protein
MVSGGYGMKRLGLFLLTVVLAFGVIGCGGGGDDDGPIEIGMMLAVECADGPATGTITNVNTGWVSGTLTLSPGVLLRVTLPEEGTYRFQFADKSGPWDYTLDVEDGDAVGLSSC